MPSHIFMHYFLTSQDEQPETLWGPRLPQKLGASLLFSKDPLPIGWGIQVIEGPNWGLFWSIQAISTALSGVVAGIYAACTKDRATAVAIGAWMVAVQTMAMAAIFFTRS
jgi:hypothetical protein